MQYDSYNVFELPMSAEDRERYARLFPRARVIARRLQAQPLRRGRGMHGGPGVVPARSLARIARRKARHA